MRARAQACASLSTVRMPLPIGSRRAIEKSIKRARRLHRDDVEMDGLAADHAAERDDAVIGLRRFSRGVDRDGDGRRDFERARHGDAVDLAPASSSTFWRPAQQRVGDVVVEARLDHEDARALGRRLLSALASRVGAAMLAPLSAAW